MRRRPLVPVIGLIALTATLVACGDADDDASSATTTVTDDSVVDLSLVPTTTVPVPDVAVPESIPTELAVTTVTPGSGPAAVDGDTVWVNYVGVRSEDGAEFDNNYGEAALPVTIGTGGVIAGWDQGLVGATAGERRQLDIPTDLAYGDTPRDTTVIQPGDALSFVIDVLAVVPPSDPADEPAADEFPLSDVLIEEATTDDLVVGEGAALEAGMTGIFQLIAARGDTGEVLQSTWVSAEAQPLVVGVGQLVPGLDDALIGMQVGGRRAITVPPDPTQGLTPETNVVIIADLVGMY